MEEERPHLASSRVGSCGPGWNQRPGRSAVATETRSEAPGCRNPSKHTHTHTDLASGSF